MAEEAVAPTSIRDRIAALNASHLPVPDSQSEIASRPKKPSPSTATSEARERPPPPPRPPAARPLPPRTRTTNNPPTLSETSVTSTKPQTNGSRTNGAVLPPPGVDRDKAKGEEADSRPHLPPRRSNTNNSFHPSPALPPRRPSENALARRDSASSISSSISSISNLSTYNLKSARPSGATETAPRIKAPEYNPSALPALPPKRNGVRNVSKGRSTSVHSITCEEETEETAPVPKLPTRRNDARRLPPSTAEPVNALRQGFQGLKSKSEAPKEPEAPPSIPGRPPITSANSDPPPIPLASRPKASVSAKPLATSDASSCLQCRDFSSPDAHAARFPRHSVSHLSPSQLANQLTSPFPSPTDKARVIFTWLHHNIAYAFEDFLSGNIKPSTPESTMHSGQAVCEGYAGLFNSMAVSAGLSSIVVGGHGKGFGHQDLPPGTPLPPFEANHAWNAVSLPDTIGGWHVIDPCWGAGDCCLEKRSYTPHFKPEYFTMGPDEFAQRHYPQEKANFFFPAGLATPSWEAYIAGAGPPVMQYCAAEYGISVLSVQPPLRRICVEPSNRAYVPTTRFVFNLACPHWVSERNGKGKMPVFCLGVHNARGPRGKDDNVPFETDGKVWWVDVTTSELGKAGEHVMCHALVTIDGKDGRGMTVAEYKRKIGRCGWTSSGVLGWDLV